MGIGILIVWALRLMITFVDSTEGSAWGPSSIDVSLPSNAANQVMLAFVNVNDANGDPTSPNITTPSGWTLVIDNGSSAPGFRRACYSKAGSGATGTVTWNFDRGIRGQVDIVTYDAIDATPVNASSFKQEAFLQTNHTNQSLTTTADNCMLVGFWADGNTGIQFNGASGMTTRVSVLAPSGGTTRPALIADVIQGSTGTSSSYTATTSANTSNVSMIMVALKPHQGPSTPILTFPTGGQTLTIGAVVNITWNQSTSPLIAQSAINYEIDYSADNGISWANIVSFTSAGVGTYAWNTTGRTAGSGYRIRIRAHDGTNVLFSLTYSISTAFTLATETAPNAPTNLSPSSGAVDKTSTIRLSWVEADGAGNPQTEATVQWSHDNFASHTVTIVVSSANLFTDVDFSGESVGATISWKVKRKGVSLYSIYASVVSFVVATAPAAPNITAPTAGSPPSSPTPTITFTEASTFTDRRMRVVVGGTQLFDSGWVNSTSLSFTSPYPFSPVSTTLFLKVRNQYLLESTEDSETFTATFTGPLVPSTTITVDNVNGFIQIEITNPSGGTTPDENDLYRYESTQTKANAIRVGRSVAVNGTFRDYGVASGKTYNYFVRAKVLSTGLFTDGSVI